MPALVAIKPFTSAEGASAFLKAFGSASSMEDFTGRSNAKTG